MVIFNDQYSHDPTVMPVGKYADFVEGDVVVQKSKKSSYGEDRYVPLTCPHCNVMFLELKETDMKTTKSSKCLNHLRTCVAYKLKGGDIAFKKPVTDEIAELKQQMAEMKEKMEDSEKEKGEMKQEIKGLQDKTGLYDSVLEAVMPSLALPLTAPVENAKITLREAAMKDVAPKTLALMAPSELVSKELHIAMIDLKDAVIDQKNEIIAIEKAHKEEFTKVYKDQLDAKDLELTNANMEKEKANKDKKEMESCMQELNKRMQEASQTATSASSRADRLQKERDALSAKYNASLKGHEQSVRNYGKHGLSPLSRSKIGMRGCATDAEAEEARAMDRAYAQVEREREAQKQAQKRAQSDGQKEGQKRARLS